MASTKKPSKEGRKAADDSTKLERLRELVAILEASDSLGELEYEDADIAVRLSRGSGAAPAPMVAHVPSPSAAPVTPPATVPTELPAPAEENLEVVKSPFVGTFYRAPSPKDPPFTEVGAKVKPKQVLCIIEAMKLMNEIESEVSGTVVEILPDNGQPVQYGDPLFKITVEK